MMTCFFPSVMIGKNNLDIYIQSLGNFNIFKKSIQKFITPSPNRTYNCFSTKDIRHVTMLRLGLSHLPYTSSSTVSWIHLIQSAVAVLTLKQPVIFLLHCPNFRNKRSRLLNNVSRLTKDKLSSCDTPVTKLHLYSDDSLDLVTNTLMLIAAVDFILSNKRFDGPLHRIIIYLVNNRLIKL